MPRLPHESVGVGHPAAIDFAGPVDHCPDGERVRRWTDATADMIFPVPLLIKLPGQTQGGVSSGDAQLIDLVTTVAAVAGVRVPWPVAGRDLFGPPGPPREKVWSTATGRSSPIRPTLLPPFPAAQASRGCSPFLMRFSCLAWTAERARKRSTSLFYT
jgi:hypothetical protein